MVQKAQFSTMAPGVHVRPHTGPTNAKLTLHYGLRVPDASATQGAQHYGGGQSGAGPRIRVANETRPFVPRGLLAFDDSFEHEVWHDGDEPRVVLICDSWHPALCAPALDEAFFARALHDDEMARFRRAARGDFDAMREETG